MHRHMPALRALVIAPLAALLLAGCGPSFSMPAMPAFKPSGGDTADFFFDPERVTITQSGRVQVNFGERALRYSGPLGCAGRAFAGDVTAHINFVFRYGSRDAWLGWDNGNVWHFTQRPRIAKGTVTFAQHFSDGRSMRVVVHCPPPPATGRL